MTKICTPARVLFQARNRRGLGHLMRGLNIAREIRALAPDAAIQFYTRSAAAQPLCEGFACYVEPDPEGMTHWQKAVDAFAPTAVVYDTMLPASVVRGTGADLSGGADRTELSLSATAPPDRSYECRNVFIMRRCKDEEQARVLSDPRLRQMDGIIVPHSAEEFGFAVPEDIAAKTHFVGPIVRPMCLPTQTQLRERYQLSPSDFVLVSTVGGGGFAEQAQRFFEIVLAAHRQLQPLLPNLHHIVVCGPHFGHALPTELGMTLVTFEPELRNLFAVAQLVVAEGGYNTVNEVRLSKTPALFLPSDRKLDDQRQRVALLATQGLAEIGDVANSVCAANAITQLCTHPQHLSAMRVAYAADQFVTGNVAAAKLILEIVANPRPLKGSR